jgi:hypothetical protein
MLIFDILFMILLFMSFYKRYKHKVLYFIDMIASSPRSACKAKEEVIEIKDMVDFENRIISILVDPGPQFPHNIQGLAESIVFCRDRKKGCGQRDEAYQMLFIWYKYFPDWALRLFGRFVYDGVGSWADVKYFCGYLAGIRCEDAYVSTCVENLTNALIDRMNTQIESDRVQWDLAIADYLEKRDIIFRDGIDVSMLGGLPKRPRALETISMAVKWVPRESSKYRWLFDKMVLRWGRKYHADYFIQMDEDNKENVVNGAYWEHELAGRAKQRVLNKLSMMYRQMVAKLSRELVYDLDREEPRG